MEPPMSFKQAQAVVCLYNRCQCGRTVARQLRLPYPACFDLVDWLWNRTYANTKMLATMPATKKALLPALRAKTWLEYLYTRDYAPEVAAASVGWSLAAVLRSCRGPDQWRRETNRQPVSRKPPRRKEEGAEADLSEEEIYRRALELRAQRPEVAQTPRPSPANLRRFSF
jgi:hypothetical protein